ncbi:MAG TPA: murein biosynthesis integral membrane protein MurJ [Gemmatimonadaceae bacterium]|nr:murein biosynthesis integral membrane protein MurJ [Gemmatimonadaceae bacterium]
MAAVEVPPGDDFRSGAGDEPPKRARAESTGRFAALIAIGILVSRVFGLVRQRVFGHYFGTSDAADAFNAAARIPNFLQNLFGEGVLSASFIPVYAGLLARGEHEEADRVAGVVGALLALVTTVLVVLGVLLTPWLVATVAMGFEGEKRELTILLVRIMFPGIGLLVCTAWCLGVLNSHRKFLLSYLAPVIWNATMIAALWWFGRRGVALPRLAEILAWSAVVGSGLQLLVQLPLVLRLAPGIRPSLDTASAHVRQVVRGFVPVFIGRGVVQISGYIDSDLASLIGSGAVSVFTYAQALYLLPGSLFGMAISAAELPAMSSLTGATDEIAALLRGRLETGLRRIAFFIVPSAMAFLALGDVIASAIYRSGRFSHTDAVWVWGTLAGSSVGLLASTMGRLYSSTFYALRDTRTPLRFAVVRVGLTLVLGYLAAKQLPHALGIDPRWGVAGLTASAGVAGWVEFTLLRRALNARIGRTGLRVSYVTRLWVSAAVAAAAGVAVKYVLGVEHAILLAVAALGVYGAIYFGLTTLLGVGDAAALVGRVAGRFVGRRGG